jgi:signal transduction histidine kinase
LFWFPTRRVLDTAGTRMLPKAKSIEAADEILGLMQKSAARMSNMIDNVLDFARDRRWQRHRAEPFAGGAAAGARAGCDIAAVELIYCR